MQRVALGQRNDFLHERANGFRLRDGRHYAVVKNDAGGQAAQQRLAGAAVPLKLMAAFPVSHFLYPASSL
jgi:hypothetical protein